MRAGWALVAVTALLLAGCSGDSDETSPERTAITAQTTVSDSTASEPADTEPAETTTTVTDEPGTTATTVVPGGPVAYTGVVDGQDAKVVVTFTKGAGIDGFEVSGLSIECQPLAPNGAAQSRTVDVAIAEAPIAADGSVMFTQADAAYEPSLSGSFAADGTFAGGLFLSGERGDFVCGGEFVFIAEPG